MSRRQRYEHLRTAPEIGAVIRTPFYDDMFAKKWGGVIVDKTPDNKWVKVRPNHPAFRRRWVPVQWLEVPA